MARLIDAAQDPSAGPRFEPLTDERLLIRALIDQLPDFLFVKDVQCRFRVANKAIAAAYGFANPEDLIGKTDFDLHPRALAQQFFERERDVVERGASLEDMEETFPDSTGVQRWYSSIKIPLRDQAGTIVGLVGVCRDITERKMMESLRVQQGAILEMIAENAPLAAVLDRLVLLMESQLSGIRGSILTFDAASQRLFVGAAPSLPEAYNAEADGVRVGPKVGSCGTAVYRREPVVVTDTYSDPLWEDIRETAKRFGLRSCWSTPILSHDGSVLGAFAMYSAEVRAPSPVETALIETTTRIAGIAIERQRSEDRIRHTAHHDALTGLPNRTMLKDLVTRSMRRADRDHGSVSVAFIDLDDFKVVNDGLGHFAGDRLLEIVAVRMAGCIGPEDAVVRLGGDEFVVLCVNADAGPSVPSPVLERIRRAVSEPVDVEGRMLQVTCSMGIATYPKDGTDVDALLRNADAAMYSVKEAGRDDIRLYTAQMNEQVVGTLFLQQQLRTAVERAEFHLVYQPQVDLVSGRIFAVEALLRWTHPVLGLVPPAQFIPIAEDSGLIVLIGDWVLRQACRQNKAWQDAGWEPIVMSVNVSPRQFRDAGWTGRIEDALRESGMAARYLELEVTEGMLMRDVPGATSTMRQLQALGVQLSIDDFGTGYSSLSALKSFPVSRLKIDQSFIRGIPDDENDKAIASAVISLSQKLGLSVIAEGVETDEQLAFLRTNNCNEGQGYLFSRPVAAEEIEAFMKPPIGASGRG